MSKQRKTCQWSGSPCEFPAVLGEKFCRTHRIEMIRRMEADGYLEPLPAPPARRRRSEREDIDATKFGTDA